MAEPSDEIDTGLANLVLRTSNEELISSTSNCLIIGQVRDKQFRFNELEKPRGVLLRPVELTFEEPEAL